MSTFDDLVASVPGVLPVLSRLGEQLAGVLARALATALLAYLLYRLRAAREDGRRFAVVVAGYVVIALLALAMLDRAIGDPANRAETLTGALGRLEFWAFCAFAGQLLEMVSLHWRTRTIAVLSVVVVGRYVGPEAINVVGGGCLLGWAVERYADPRWRWATAAVHAVMSIAVVGWFWHVHWEDSLGAIQGWGLACWALMRHASFVVEARRGASTRLSDYVCYLLFFPSCFGAMEVYDEFAGRNLERRQRVDLRAGVLGAIRSDVLVRCALLIPITQGTWLASVGFFELWWHSILWFLRGALFLGGLWAMIEADARLLGFEVRPNFTGVVSAPNPSRFWRAWRGTMTHWLIRYVYIPLGGSRHHRTRNVFAAFLVSTAWHVAGVAFVLPPLATGMAFVPTLSWGFLNFLGVAAHGAWRRRWPPGTFLPIDSRVGLAVKIALTLCFGSLTVTVLGFPRERVDEFATVMCTLAGLGGVCGR